MAVFSPDEVAPPKTVFSPDEVAPQRAVFSPDEVAPPAPAAARATTPDRFNSKIGSAPEQSLGIGERIQRNLSPLIGPTESQKQEESVIGPSGEPEYKPLAGDVEKQGLTGALSKPYIPIPKVIINKDDSAIMAAGKQILNTGLGVGEFAESPLGTATGGANAIASAIVKRLIPAMFAADISRKTPEVSAKAGEASAVGTPAEKGATFVDLGATIGMPAGLVLATVKGGGKAEVDVSGLKAAIEANRLKPAEAPPEAPEARQTAPEPAKAETSIPPEVVNQEPSREPPPAQTDPEARQTEIQKAISDALAAESSPVEPTAAKPEPPATPKGVGTIEPPEPKADVQVPASISNEPKLSFPEWLDEFHNMGFEYQEFPLRQAAEEMIGRPVTEAEWTKLQQAHVDGRAVADEYEKPISPPSPALPEPKPITAIADTAQTAVVKAGGFAVHSPDGEPLGMFRNRQQAELYARNQEPKGVVTEFTAEDEKLPASFPAKDTEIRAVTPEDVSGDNIIPLRPEPQAETGEAAVARKLADLKAKWDSENLPQPEELSQGEKDAHARGIKVGSKVLAPLSAKGKKPYLALVTNIDDTGITVQFKRDKTYTTLPPQVVSRTLQAEARKKYEADFADLKPEDRPGAKKRAAEFVRMLQNEGSALGWFNHESAMMGVNERDRGFSKAKEIKRAIRIAFKELGIDGDPENSLDRAKALEPLKQKVNFHEATREGDGKMGTDAEHLAPGDVIDLGEEKVKVLSRGEDGSLVLDDGSKFGVQKLEDGTTIYVDSVDESPPPPQPKLKTAEPPKLRPMENQGDLMAKQQEPFALVGEKGADADRIAKAKSDSEQARIARENFDKEHQQELGGLKPKSGDRGESGMVNLDIIRPVVERMQKLFERKKGEVDREGMHLEDLPEKFQKLFYDGQRFLKRQKAKWDASGNRQTLSATKDAADNMAQKFANSASNMVLHDLNRGFEAKGLKDIQGREKMREAALIAMIEAGGDRAKGSPKADVISRLQDQRDLLTHSEKAFGPLKRQYLRAIDFAIKNYDKLAKAAETYRNITDTEHLTENTAGIETLYRKDGYVYHDQDMGAGALFPEEGSDYAGAPTPFMKSRKYQTYAESIANGETPKSLSAVDLLRKRLELGRRAINYRAWMDSMLHLEDPTTKLPIAVAPEIAIRADGKEYSTVPDGYKLQNFAGRQMGVQKGYAGIFDHLTSGSKMRVGGAEAWMKFATAAKHFILIGDTFHLARLAFWNTFTRGGIPRYERGLTLLDNTLEEFKTMVKHGDIPKEWVKGATEDYAISQELIKSGYNLGSVGDNLYKEWIEKYSPLSGFNKFLFDKYQRGAMNEVGIIEFKRQTAEHPELSRDQVMRQVALDLNKRFGNLQNQSWVKSKTFQDIARIFFLAPQWNEGLIRSELGAMGQILKAPIDSIRNRRLQMGTLGRGVAYAVLGQILANQIINYAFRGHSTFQNPEEQEGAKISAWIPDAAGSSGFFLNPLGIPAEISELLYKGASRHKGDFLLAMKDYLRGRLGPVARPADVLYSGEETGTGRKIKGGVNRAKEMVKAAIPVPISGGAIGRFAKQQITGEHEELRPGEYQQRMMQSFGVRSDIAASPVQRIGRLASEFNDQRGVPQNPDYNGSDYDALNNALKLQNRRDQQAAIEELLTKKKPLTVQHYYQSQALHPFTHSSKFEPQFISTLNDDQYQTYQQAKKDKQAISQRFGAAWSKYWYNHAAARTTGTGE